MVKQRTTVLVMALVVALLVTGWPQPGQAGPAPIPYYFTRAIKPADLKGKTLRELTLMRNTIYARAGNTFRKKWLRAHFEGQPWYKPTGLDPDKLTDRDRANADAICAAPRHRAGQQPQRAQRPGDRIRTAWRSATRFDARGTGPI